MFVVKNTKIVSTNVIISSLGLHGFFWFCQIQSEHREVAKIEHPRERVSLKSQPSWAEQIHPETQDFLGSLQPQKKGSISFTAAPKKERFVCFRTALAPMHWEISPLAWHELQQARNSHELPQETETLVFSHKPQWWNAPSSSHTFAIFSFCCHEHFPDPTALQNRTNFFMVKKIQNVSLNLLPQTRLKSFIWKRLCRQIGTNFQNVNLSFSLVVQMDKPQGVQSICARPHRLWNWDSLAQLWGA